MDTEAGVNLRFWSLWTTLLLVATALRLPFPAWDAGIAAHPDERFLIGVAEATSLWGDPTRAAPDFPYGHLPIYLARLVVPAASGSDPLYALRLLSGLIGVLLVAVTGALGRQLAGKRGAFWTAALVAVAPFPIQQAHFYTVDPLGATLASVAVLAALRRRWRMAGALLGLAVACKASLVWLGVPLGFAMLSAGESRARAGRSLLLAAGVTFALAAPWALLRPVAAWRGPLIQAGMAAGRYDFPYTRQYAGTLPWLYPLAQLALWGLGPAVALGGVDLDGLFLDCGGGSLCQVPTLSAPALSRVGGLGRPCCAISVSQALVTFRGLRFRASAAHGAAGLGAIFAVRAAPSLGRGLALDLCAAAARCDHRCGGVGSSAAGPLA